MQKHAHFPPYLYQEKSFTLTCLEYGYMCINEYILLETFLNCTLSLTYMVWKDCIHFIQTQHTVYQQDHPGSVCVHYSSTNILSGYFIGVSDIMILYSYHRLLISTLIIVILSTLIFHNLILVSSVVCNVII